MKKSLLLVSFSLIALVGCEEMVKEIDWDTESIPKRLAVEGSITNELKIHRVRLTASSDYFSNTETEVVSGATVSISDGTAVDTLTENPAGSGNYETRDSIQGETGESYTLNITLEQPLNGETQFTATCKLQKGFWFDSLAAYIFDNPLQIDEQTDSLLLVVDLFGQEPATVNDYYLVNLIINDTLQTDTIDEAYLIHDISQGINEENVVSLYHEIGNIFPGDRIEVEIRSINQHYYDFLNGLNQLVQGGDPLGFGGPPANAPGNIQGGGALGFFIASDVGRKSAIALDLRDFQ
jgi:hypothetical protein